jgi:hypothetical protein
MKKALLEIPAPENCRDCLIAVTYADCNDNDKTVCGYTNGEVTGYTDRRAPDCPLKITPEG